MNFWILKEPKRFWKCSNQHWEKNTVFCTIVYSKARASIQYPRYYTVQFYPKGYSDGLDCTVDQNKSLVVELNGLESSLESTEIFLKWSWSGETVPKIGCNFERCSVWISFSCPSVSSCWNEAFLLVRDNQIAARKISWPAGSRHSIKNSKECFQIANHCFIIIMIKNSAVFFQMRSDQTTTFF